MNYEYLTAIMNRSTFPTKEIMSVEDALLLTKAAEELLKEARRISYICYECDMDDSKAVKAKSAYKVSAEAYIALIRRDSNMVYNCPEMESKAAQYLQEDI